ncbi:MAG TPA: hypothetical protein VK081_07155, partial [Planctomycetota bacterium]|nr:hypothetical protein [Planctomycetota bacterium]
MPRVRCTLAAFLLAALVAGQALPGPAEYLVLDALGQGGRSAVFVDPVAARLARGTWRTPTAGDAVEAAGGRNAAWRTVRAAPDGSFEDPALRGGWALARVASEADRIVLLAARGHRAVFVDGEPRAGDPYDLGSVRLPVLLRAGTTELLFQGSRGRLAVTFVPPPAEAYLDDLDATLPDVLSGEPRELFAGILAGNASLAWRRACTIEALVDGAARTTAPFDLPPLSRRKVAVVLPPIDAPPGTRVAVALRLRDADGRVLHESSVQLEARDPGGLHRRTFLSRIDGSVQYYAVRPATGASPEPRGLVLTLHGAGVEASAQAACYAAKEWAHVVAPTNRRPYGFDWEDWG